MDDYIGACKYTASNYDDDVPVHDGDDGGFQF